MAIIKFSQIEIETGFLHQIRVVFSKIGHPVLGDKKYFSEESDVLSNTLKISRNMLHANALYYNKNNHSDDVFSSNIEAVCPLPDDFSALLARLRKNKKK